MRKELSSEEIKIQEEIKIKYKDLNAKLTNLNNIKYHGEMYCDIAFEEETQLLLNIKDALNTNNYEISKVEREIFN